jgi:hypothetical protein
MFVAVLIIFGGCATGRKAYVAQDSEELYGVWVNDRYLGTWGMEMQKIEYKPNGVFYDYKRIDDTNPRWEYEYEIEEKWTDAVGDVWYKTVRTNSILNYSANVLCKITDGGKTLELCFYTGHMPIEIHPTSPLYTYWIYYRQ